MAQLVMPAPPARPKPVEYVRCKCERIGFTADHWKERPEMLDGWGQHSLTSCVHWASLPDEVARICKMLAGTFNPR